MTKSETLQLRTDADDMLHLRAAADRAGVSLSDFVRRELEPTIVAAKVATIAKDFSYISRVRLFGSMARREHDAESDIDLAIDTDGTYKWMGENGMARFVARIEESTGRTVDVVKAKYCSDDLAQKIDRDGKVVYAR